MHSSTHYSPLKNGDGASSDYSVIDRYAMRFKIVLDKDWSFREKKLFILKKFLEGSIYDNLSPFHVEFGGGGGGGEGGSYIKLCERRPSVIYNINKIIVDESSTMLFGLDHFPTIRCGKDHENTTQFLQYVTRKSKLRRVMLEAAKTGSVGSVCVIIKVLNKNFYFEVIETKNLKPTFDRMNPDKLLGLIEKRKVDGSTLRSHKYIIKDDDLNKFFYLVREWNVNQEIYYVPYLCEDEKDNESFEPQIDSEKSENHDFGFLPAIWIKNLPSSQNIDGACTFESILDIGIEIDYQESQLGRLFKYNSDPTLVIKNPSTMQGSQLIKSLTVLNLDEKGDAYYAEMAGKACSEVMSYIDKLRQFALEVARGNRTSPDKVTMAQSGKAIQMLNSALIGLVNEMRITYGDDGLLSIYQMILDISKSSGIEIDFGDVAPDADCGSHLTLDWPDWYPKSSQEELQEQQALSGYINAGLLSKETALNVIADEYNILDTNKELKLIEKQSNEDHNKQMSIKQAGNAGGKPDKV
jgi:hypothetical protein